MTTYAIDPDRRMLVASWSLGIGAAARDVGSFSPTADAEKAVLLADSLTLLSEHMWLVYSGPGAVEAPGDLDEMRRQGRERAVSEVATIMRSPAPPSNGLQLDSYEEIVHVAQEVARVLHELQEPSLVDAVARDVGEEADAVTRACRGDLTGRAAQAVTLTRLDASPVQVVAADDVLARELLDPQTLLETVEPSAACIAAAHWLCAAAVVASAVADVQPAETFAESETVVFAESETVEPTETGIAAGVVHLVEEKGTSPRRAVMILLEETMAVVRGELPVSLLGRIGYAANLEDDGIAGPYLPLRACLLDPARPAWALLGDLVNGIQAALTLFQGCVDVDGGGTPSVGGVVLSPPDGHRWEPLRGDDDEGWEPVNEAAKAEFLRRVTVEATRRRDRLS